MWEQITQADIERARKELSLKRAETLRRQAEEIEGLDAQFQDIERFEGVVAAFVEEFMSPEICTGGLRRIAASFRSPAGDCGAFLCVQSALTVPLGRLY